MTPSPAEILAARKAAGLTQTEAARLVASSCRSWQQWEAGDRRMHPGLWELFGIKSGRQAVKPCKSPSVGDSELT